MMIKLLAVLCRLAAPHDCHDQEVTTSITMGECLIAVKSLPEWSNQFPAYYVGGWRCQIGIKATERGA